MNTINWADKARRQVAKIKNVAERKMVFDAVGTLADFPNAANVKKLTNHVIGYRLRVGQWRVLFDFDGSVKVIHIEEVKKRNERTY